MLMYSWMSFIEKAPERYDWAVKLMTGGRIDKIKKMIAEKIKNNGRVLDVGCGTGSLGVLCLDNGVKHFIGLDASRIMLDEFKRKIQKTRKNDQVTLIRDSVTQLKKHIEKNSLDAIVSTMAFGEFPREYLDYIFKDCHELLKPNGHFIVADEVLPKNLLVRFLYRIIMVIMWVPQYVILRRVFYPIKNLKKDIEEAGFSVYDVKKYPFSTFQLIMSKK